MKKNKKLVILAVVLILVFIGIIALFFYGDNNIDNREQLLFECDKVISSQKDIETAQKVKSYKNGNSRKFVLSSILEYKKDISEKQLDAILVMLNQKAVESLDDKFGENSEVISKRDSKKIYLDIVFEVNESNHKQTEKIFYFDLHNSTIQEIITYFEKEGFNCQVQ